MLDNETAFRLLLAVTLIVVVVWAVMRLKRPRRPRIHPRLQKYAGEDSELAQQRRAEAAKIVATSSTATVAGYKVVRQVEAVFVEGFRRPEEALDGIKAVAAMKGANAVLNLRHERNAAGKCCASGDAVVIQPEDEPSA